MIEQLTTSNFVSIIEAFIEKERLTIWSTASVIGCSKPTLTRLLSKVTLPTEEMLRQTSLLIALGHKQYSKIGKGGHEKIADSLGAAGGAAVGFGAVIPLVSGLGVPGLAASGVTSGLATIGGLLGGGMVTGTVLTGGIPLAFCGIGFGIVQGTRWFVRQKKLNASDVDSKWEYVMPSLDSSEATEKPV